MVKVVILLLNKGITKPIFNLLSLPFSREIFTPLLLPFAPKYNFLGYYRYTISRSAVLKVKKRDKMFFYT